MRAKNLTKPKKKKCSNCQGDLPNTYAAPPVLSVTGKEICAECKLAEIYDELIGPAPLPQSIDKW